MADETTLAETPVAAPVEQDQTTKIEAPEAEVETKPEAETAGEEKPEDEAESEEQPKKKIPGSQRLKRRLELIEQEHLTLLQENERLKQERQPPKADNEGQPGIDREPKESDFPNDWFSYQEARTAWAARKAVRDEFNRVQEESRRANSDRVQGERQRELLAAYEENAEEVRERIPDFDKVVANAKDVIAKRELIEEILSSDKSALLQYHLAKHPEKVKELNELSGRALAREIGRLEARVHLPTPKKATEANAPPSEVKGAAAPPVDPQSGPDDMNAYVAWRRKQMAS